MSDQPTAGPSQGDADSAVPGGPPAQRSGKGTKGGFIREVAIILVTALVLSAVVRTFLVQAFYVPTGSMENTLLVGDRILVWKPGGGSADRGDIIVFKDPSNWLADPVPAAGAGGALTGLLSFVGLIPDPNSDALVKRVIGVGGDTVTCCDAQGRILVNGKPVDEPFIKEGETTDQVRFNVKVPAGRLFVMGDNRGDSADSRYHLAENQGTVPESAVIGPVVLLMWPPGRWGVPD